MNTRSWQKHLESGAALMAVLFVIALMAATIGVIYTLTGTEGRFMKRSVDRATAIAYGDGVIECLFDQWRLASSSTIDNTQRTQGFTYNELMVGTPTSPSTSVPSPLPLKAPTSAQLPAPVGISLASWSVTPADPYLSPITGATTRPTQENGTNSKSRLRTYYIARAIVNYPRGSVIVERPFVRAGRNIFDNFLFSTQPVTEIHPGAPMCVNGTVYVGGDLYTGTSNLNFNQDVTYTGNWNIAYAPNDPHASTPSSPSWPTGGTPHSGAQQKLLDTPLSSLDPNFIDGTNTNDTDSDSNLNNDGYHELVEEKVKTGAGAGTDPLETDTSNSERLAPNADYRIYIDKDNNVTIYKGTSNTAMTSGTDYTAIMNALTTNTTIVDGREGDNVRLVNVDVSKLASSVNSSASTYDTVGGNDGLLIYIQDKSVGTSVTTPGYTNYTTGTTASGNLVATATGASSPVTSSAKRGVRLVNGGALPNIGLTVATPNPVYIQGDYNSGATTNYSSTAGGTSSGGALTVTNKPNSDGSSAYPSGTSSPTETATGYDKKSAAVVADAVTILSNGWSDGNSNAVLGSRVPQNTTVNTAIVAGNVPTSSSAYSGGIENFPRLLENWTSSNTANYYLTIHGSFGLLYDSEQSTGVWKATGNYYNAPSRRWFYDTILQDKNPPGFPVAYAYDMGAWTLKTP